MNDKAFNSFIYGDSCSSRDFLLAVKYFKDANFEDKTKFYKKLNFIVSLCLEKLISSHEVSFGYVRDIYQKYGIYDIYFEQALSMYLFAHSDDLLVKQYLATVNKGGIKVVSQLFWEAKNELWDSNKINGLAHKYRISFYQAKRLIEFYAQEKLGILPEDFKKYRSSYKNFLSFINNEKVSKKVKDEAYYYYQTYALPHEKERFCLHIKNILEQVCLNHYSALQVLNIYGCNNYDLYLFTIFLPDLDEQIKLDIIQRFQSYYEQASDVLFKRVEITRLARQENIRYENYMSLVKGYAKEVLHNDHIEEDIRFIKRRTAFTKRIYLVLDQIKNEEDEEIIRQVLINNHVQTDDIHNYCYGVLCYLEKDEQRRLEKKFLICLRKIQKENVEKNLPLNLGDPTLLYEYLQSSDHYEKFCALRGLNVDSFKQRIRQVKTQPLARQLNDKLDQDIIHKKDGQIWACKEIFACIQNGVHINGIHRDFTLVDYFKDYAHLHVHEIALQKTALNGLEKKTLNKFFAPFKAGNAIGENVVLHTTYEFDSLKDEKGFPIKGTGRILTEEEMMQIIEFFKQYHIPFIDTIVNYAARCYYQNTLFDTKALQRN